MASLRLKLLLAFDDLKYKLIVDKAREQVPPNAQVLIKELHSSFCEKSLVNLCISFGDIVSAKVVLNEKTKKCEGCGVVEFSSAANAMACIAGLTTKGIKAEMGRAGAEGPVKDHLTLGELREFIRVKRPDLVEKGILEESNYFFEIFDSDFKEYVHFDADTEIKDLSRLRVRSLQSLDELETKSNHSLSSSQISRNRHIDVTFASLSELNASQETPKTERLVLPEPKVVSGHKQQADTRPKVTSNEGNALLETSTLRPLTPYHLRNVQVKGDSGNSGIKNSGIKKGNQSKASPAFPRLPEPSKPSQGISMFTPGVIDIPKLPCPEDTGPASKKLAVPNASGTSPSHSHSMESPLENRGVKRTWAQIARPAEKKEETEASKERPPMDPIHVTEAVKCLMKEIIKLAYKLALTPSEHQEYIWFMIAEAMDQKGFRLYAKGSQCKSAFIKLCKVYLELKSKLNSGLTFKEANDLWSLFSIFYNDLEPNLSLREFVDSGLETGPVKTNGRGANGSSVSEIQPSSGSTLVGSAVSARAEQPIVVAEPARPLAPKEGEAMALVDLVKHYNDAFVGLPNWRVADVWHSIDREMKGKGYYISKTYERTSDGEYWSDFFEHLLLQYCDLLRNCLDDCSLEQITSYWPCFPKFHFEFSLKPFAAGVDILQEVISCSSNILRQCDIYAAESQAASAASQCDTNLGKKQQKADDVQSLSESDHQLIATVYRNRAELLDDNLTEDFFWRKLSYDMAFFLSPLSNDSHGKWKNTFYQHLSHYFDLCLCEETTRSQWPLFRAFEQMDKSFLEKLGPKAVQFRNHANPKSRSREESSQEALPQVLKGLQNLSVGDQLERKVHLIRCVRKELKTLVNPETTAKGWTRVKQAMISGGHFPSSSKVDIRSYFGSDVGYYLRSLSEARDLDEAGQMCPYFSHLHCFDLTGLIKPKDIESYEFHKKRLEDWKLLSEQP